MQKFILFILVLGFVACSSRQEKPHSTLVDTFITQWKEDYEPEDSYAEIYRAYLHSVEDLYHAHHLETKFPHYLSSVDNMNQLIAHTEFNMPYRYKAEKRRHANPRSKEFINYSNSVLRYTRTKLNNDRLQKLKDDVGADFFAKLEENRKLFLKSHSPINLPL